MARVRDISGRPVAAYARLSCPEMLPAARLRLIFRNEPRRPIVVKVRPTIAQGRDRLRVDLRPLAPRVPRGSWRILAVTKRHARCQSSEPDIKFPCRS